LGFLPLASGIRPTMVGVSWVTVENYPSHVDGKRRRLSVVWLANT
jgi:hypothetical protein